MNIDVQAIAWRLLRRLSRAESRRQTASVVPRLEILEDRVVLDDTSAGLRGINARAIQTPDRVVLTGEGVVIGQLESGRPGRPGFDNAANSNTDVRPTAVYLGVNNGVANQDINNHAETVAGVMIANGARDSGVSPRASLHASAEPGGSVVTTLATQELARTAWMSAINLSTGLLPGNVPLDGSSLYTKFIDYSASKHDVLHFVAGNQTGPSVGAAVPTVPKV